MLGLKLNHVSKRGHWTTSVFTICCCIPISAGQGISAFPYVSFVGIRRSCICRFQNKHHSKNKQPLIARIPIVISASVAELYLTYYDILVIP